LPGSGQQVEAEAGAMPTSVPAVLAAWMQPFAVYFTTAVWRHVLVLVEPYRVFRRLLILEGWSHDQAYTPVFS
jgi:hypothetical protein